MCAHGSQWQKDKKNLRALLASLHEIAPPCQWKAMSLSELLDASAVKRAYKRALLAVHPDKQPPEDLEKKVCVARAAARAVRKPGLPVVSALTREGLVSPMGAP